MYTWFAFMIAKRQQYVVSSYKVYIYLINLHRVTFSAMEIAYLSALPVVHLVYVGSGLLSSTGAGLEAALLHPLSDGPFAFLPLMLVSIYCSVGISYVWLMTVATGRK